MAMTESSWLADGVKEIERIAKTSMIVEPRIIQLPEKSGTYGIVTPGPAGSALSIETKVAGPKWHNERLENPDQLILFIKSLAEHRDRTTDAGAVYIGRETIRFVYDFGDRRDRATVPLTVSTPWRWLTQANGPMDQRAIVRLLRITFADCLPDGSPLVDVLRNVKWTSTGQVEANLQKGKEALGRQILNEAAGINNFPDEFMLTVRPFENYRHTVTVRCALEILPDVQKFEVIPFPNQLHDGMTETLLRLQAEITEQAEVPTFLGAVSNRGDEGGD